MRLVQVAVRAVVVAGEKLVGANGDEGRSRPVRLVLAAKLLQRGRRPTECTVGVADDRRRRMPDLMGVPFRDARRLLTEVVETLDSNL